MIEGPQAVDDRDIVAGVGAEADAVADFAGENLDLALVAALGRRRKMFPAVRR